MLEERRSALTMRRLGSPGQGIRGSVIGQKRTGQLVYGCLVPICHADRRPAGTVNDGLSRFNPIRGSSDGNQMSINR